MNSSLALQGLPRGMRLYASGNSYFGNMFEQYFCASEGIDVWYLGGTSYLGYSAVNDAMMMFLANDGLCKNVASEISLLRDTMEDVDVCIIGALNEAFKERTRNPPSGRRTPAIIDAFPNAKVIEWRFDRILAAVRGHPDLHGPAYGCPGDFQECKGSRTTAHTCIPGPVMYRAEEVMRMALEPKAPLNTTRRL